MNRIVKEAQSGWYLVFTKPHHENIASINLQRQGFHIYFPLIQQHKRRQNLYKIVTEPLFPRYLFIHLNSEKEDWSKMRSTRGCVSLVRFGQIPARIPDALVLQLKQDEATRVIQDEKMTPAFKSGDRVRILEGVMSAYHGIVEVKNSPQRVTLLLTIAEGHTRSVSLPTHQIEMAN